MLVTHLSTVHFDRHLAALPIVCLVHVVTQAFNIELPLSLLYGPLLYIFSSRNLPLTSLGYIHFFPFLIFSFLYILLLLGSQFNLSWIPEVSAAYTDTRFVAAIVSLAAYGFFVLFSKGKAGYMISYSLAKKISMVYIVSSAAIGLSLYGFAVNASLFTPIAPVYLLAALTFIMVVAKGSGSNHRLDTDEDPAAIRANLACIRESLEDRKLFLNSSLTLELLAKDTSMSRKHLSYTIHTYANTSFYQLVAWYRIQYIIAKLSAHDAGTIESLAYESGFNSKTSLNKYFREFTGMTPSEFRSGGSPEITLSPKQIL